MNSIASTIKNPRLHDANRPFGGSHMGKKPQGCTNPDALEICNDPLPAGRASSGKKYDATFSALKPGQAIKCTPADVGRVAGALRKWLEQKGSKTDTVRTIKDYGDGKGRVWLLKAPKAGA